MGRRGHGLNASFTVRQGHAVLWYPERKFFLLGRTIVPSQWFPGTTP